MLNKLKLISSTEFEPEFSALVNTHLDKVGSATVIFMNLIIILLRILSDTYRNTIGECKVTFHIFQFSILNTENKVYRIAMKTVASLRQDMAS